MHRIYNSRNLKHKTPFGALRQGESVTFVLYVPHEIDCKTPHIVFGRDGEVPSLFVMAKQQKEHDRQTFSITLTPEKAGLYFYHFDLYTEYRKLFCAAGGESYITTNDGKQWQLTVYDSAFKTPTELVGGVMYQIFPDRFCKSGNLPTESENVFSDRILRENEKGEPYFWPNEKGGHLNMDYFGGNFKGIESKLPYLSSLGVDILYLNPIFEAHANHRYNTADYLKADPILGTNEEFSHLCKAAQEHGIRIILDGVFSHTGSDSIYFNREKRYGEGGAFNDENSEYRSWFDFSADHKCGYRSWWGFETLPEVNENDANYRNFICGENGVIDTWIKLGAAGFRLDVADELPDDFIVDIRNAVKKHGDDKYLLGEVWEDATTKWSYGSRREYLLGKGLDATMNYPFKEAVLDFCKGASARKTAEKIMSICENYPQPALHVLMNFMSTHDTMRAITALAGESCDGKDRYWQSGRKLTHEQYEQGIKLMRLAYAMIFTLPGIPCVYYGDEIAMQGYKDPFNRAFFDWDNSETRIKETLIELAQKRKQCCAFKTGDMKITHAKSGVLCYERVCESHRASVSINTTENAVTLHINDMVQTLQPYDYSVEIESCEPQKHIDIFNNSKAKHKTKKRPIWAGWFSEG